MPVGGNHEASNHLWELYYGGWVAPRIYYLGAAGIFNIGGLRIAGLSGIWAQRVQHHFHEVAMQSSFGPCTVAQQAALMSCDVACNTHGMWRQAPHMPLTSAVTVALTLRQVPVNSRAV